MSQNPNVRTLQAMYEAFGRGDLAFVLDHLTPNVEWGFNAFPGVPMYGVRHGRDGAASFFKDLDATVEIQKFEPYRFVADGDDVICFLNIHGKAKGTGKAIKQEPEVHVFKFENGKVRSARFYHDVAAMVSAFQVPAAIH